MTRALVCGWFSIDGGETTAGDLLVMAAVRDALTHAGVDVDVAKNEGFADGLRLAHVQPEAYASLVFACGPLHGEAVDALLDRFPHARSVAVSVSMVDERLAERFDVVLARDGAGAPSPDLSVGRDPDDVPLVGVVRAHPQPEYGAGGHARADEAIRTALASRPCATIEFGTRVHPAADPLAPHARRPAEVTTLAARMDAMVTTRLHGLALALARGTPAVAVDPIPGGAKVTEQAAVLRWPCSLPVDEADPEQIAEALTWCLTDEARRRAARVAAEASPGLRTVRQELVGAVQGGQPHGDAPHDGGRLADLARWNRDAGNPTDEEVVARWQRNAFE